ncbi:hypothetical protein CXU22_00410 [Akkermansia muciniphila]|uniref:Uncharacterized protein n=1 Tax=Akkermansia muciniphila TaxID=239935 RepID=A0A2N8HGW2_9BACT|nr:hypothetical protein CXU22_00410 [Akkermansia muciniphila]
MRHFILIKSRCRLNGQPAVPFLKEILNRNSGRPSGLQSRLPKQENMLYQTSKHFYFQHNKQAPYPFHPSGPAMEGENGLPPFPSAPRTPEQPRWFLASPNDTQSSFTEPGHVDMHRSSPASIRRKKQIPPSFIPSKTPPFRGTGKDGVSVAETEN